LKPYRLKINYLRVGGSTSNLLVLDDGGHFRKATVTGITADPGPEVNCGWRVDSRQIRVTLPAKTLIPWDWVIRIGYIATAPATTTVTAAGMSVPVEVHRGLGVLFLMVRGSVDSLQIGPLSNHAALCSNDIQVGTPSAVPGTTP
jgi:hypothetical protein